MPSYNGASARSRDPASHDVDATIDPLARYLLSGDLEDDDDWDAEPNAEGQLSTLRVNGKAAQNESGQSSEGSSATNGSGTKGGVVVVRRRNVAEPRGEPRRIPDDDDWDRATEEIPEDVRAGWDEPEPPSQEPTPGADPETRALRRNAAKAWLSDDHRTRLFFKVTDLLLARTDLSPRDVLIYSDLRNIDFKGVRGFARVGQKTLAASHHVGEHEIGNRTKKLEEALLLTRDKQGNGRVTVYYLHDSWGVHWANDLNLPWQVVPMDTTDASGPTRSAGPKCQHGADGSVDRPDESVRSNGQMSPHHREKSWSRAGGDSSVEDVPPPEATARARTHPNKENPTEIEVYLDGVDFWDPQLGRTRFELELIQLGPSQLGCESDPVSYLRHNLPIIVTCWESTHRLRFQQSESGRPYKGSPYTSLDIQRFVLLTLEQNLDLTIADLVLAAQDPQLVAPTPKYFLQALDRCWDRDTRPKPEASNE